MRRLTPVEELAWLAELDDDPVARRRLDELRAAFDTLHLRAQALLGLIAICLTITGFSGPRIAASGAGPAAALVGGLIGVVGASVVLLTGPLQLSWVSSEHSPAASGAVEDTLVRLLQRRDRRTQRLRLAQALLVAGLSSYIAGVVWYLCTGMGGEGVTI